MSNTSNTINKTKRGITTMLDGHVHDHLVKLSGSEMAKTGKRVSISKVIEIALQIPSPQMSEA